MASGGAGRFCWKNFKLLRRRLFRMPRLTITDFLTPTSAHLTWQWLESHPPGLEQLGSSHVFHPLAIWSPPAQRESVRSAAPHPQIPLILTPPSFFLPPQITRLVLFMLNSSDAQWNISLPSPQSTKPGLHEIREAEDKFDICFLSLKDNPALRRDVTFFNRSWGYGFFHVVCSPTETNFGGELTNV